MLLVGHRSKHATLLESHEEELILIAMAVTKRIKGVATRITVCFMGARHSSVVSSQLFHSTFTAVFEELLQVFLLH